MTNWHLIGLLFVRCGLLFQSTQRSFKKVMAAPSRQRSLALYAVRDLVRGYAERMKPDTPYLTIREVSTSCQSLSCAGSTEPSRRERLRPSRRTSTWKRGRGKTFRTDTRIVDARRKTQHENLWPRTRFDPHHKLTPLRRAQ